ncbi:MAG TPA: DUF2272 domain-containing protein [Allosphingosinicella sp.]|nr:DUF2272 domain-containing protein [Allosphingosinicella sp.]
MSAFTAKLAQICLDEYSRWDNGAGRENQGTNDKPPAKRDYYLFVKEYWVSIGNMKLDGKTIVKGIRPPWSSAFVSFCVRKAEAGNRFNYAEAHCHYIAPAMAAADSGSGDYGYIAMRPKQYKPSVGDIVCSGREYAERYDYDQAKLIYEADSFYPSHGDIVVEITGTHAIVIGGNVNHNVDRKRLPLDASGFLKDREVTRKGKKVVLPWITILSCRL